MTLSRRLAVGSTHAFVNELLDMGSEDRQAAVGDTISFDGEYGDVENAEVVDVVDGHPFVRWTNDQGATLDEQLDDEHWYTIETSPAIAGAWERHLREGAPDGIAWDDGAVSDELAARLNAHFDQLLERVPVDHHPGSGTIVRDLVHPSLFPFVEGRSALVPNARRPGSEPAGAKDMWGRPYESSKFQWLPTPFEVGDDGGVQVAGTINNLDPDLVPGVYGSLAELFAAALPLLESVVGYARATKFYDDSLEGEHELPDPPGHAEPLGAAESVSLRGRTLQVIPKIVEYTLGEGGSFEGVWHVEGMSHEHVLATVVFTPRRDAALQGGSIRFKRPYTLAEAGQVFWNIDQCRPRPVEDMVDEGVVPLGTLETLEGRLFVFPNSHIHKLTTMSAAPGSGPVRRRVIVFWLVDPDTEILSTREVQPLQNTLSLDEAKALRLELMEERRRHKQSLNVRAVSLCEH